MNKQTLTAFAFLLDAFKLVLRLDTLERLGEEVVHLYLEYYPEATAVELNEARTVLHFAQCAFCSFDGLLAGQRQRKRETRRISQTTPQSNAVITETARAV